MSIKIDLMIAFFIIFFCITSQIEIYLILLFFAIFHEIGHLIVGLFLGFKPKEIQINIAGVRIEFKPKIEEYNKRILKGSSLSLKRAIIAMAGPITNFLIIAILQLISIINPKFVLSNMGINVVYANFLIGIFNLIPIYPLDGGRILKEILYIFKGLKKSYIYTYKISKITIIVFTAISSIAILYLRNFAVVIILIYLWALVFIERSRYKRKMMVYGNCEN